MNVSLSFLKKQPQKFVTKKKKRFYSIANNEFIFRVYDVNIKSKTVEIDFLFYIEVSKKN